MSGLTPALAVVHVLDAMSTGNGVWGKERLVEGLMLAQRASGEVDPRLIAFAPCALAGLMLEHGFAVDILEPKHRRLPWRSLAALRASLRRSPPALAHSHGYKANLLCRLARAPGLPHAGLVATCHAWFDESRATKLYNELDRQSAFLSDVTTVADQRMLARFPRRGRLAYVANGLPPRAPPTAGERTAARARFGFPESHFVVGFLARTNAVKGIPEVLEAAQRSRREPILWAIAGSGDLSNAIEAAALPNVRYVGYVSNSDGYRAGLDAFVQASHVEGLSLALLEAMRARLPIVATDAGSTTLAVRNESEALVVAPGDVAGLLAAVLRLTHDRELGERLGAAARARFNAEFGIMRQHRAFLDIYRSCAAPQC